MAMKYVALLALACLASLPVANAIPGPDNLEIVGVVTERAASLPEDPSEFPGWAMVQWTDVADYLAETAARMVG